MAVTYTQTDLDTLKAAFVTGALEVQIGDRKVTYRSQKELLVAIRIAEESINGISDDVADNPNVIQASYSRSPRTRE